MIASGAAATSDLSALLSSGRPKRQPRSPMCQCTTDTPMMFSSPLSRRTISVRWAQGQA